MKKSYILLGLMLCVIIGGGLLLSMKKNESRTTSDATSPGMIQGTLADLAQKGMPLKCTYTHTAPDTQSKGTMYLSGENMKGDFEGTYNGTIVLSHMIRVNDTSYVWTDAEKKGVKMSLTQADAQAMKESAAQMQKSNPGTIDVDNQVMDYQCRPWVADAQAFAPPSDVEFTDMTAMMEQMQKRMPTASQETKESMQQSQCDVCAQLPAGDAQNQCKKALGCE